MFNEKFMNIAIKMAKKAEKRGEMPVGCVIVYKNKIISKGYNKKEKLKTALAHAEVIAIKKANKKLKNWRLNDCELYVTLEPCPMCASLIHQSRIKKIYFGCFNNNKNNSDIIKKILVDKNSNNVVNISGPFLEDECTKILKNFFKKRRVK